MTKEEALAKGGVKEFTHKEILTIVVGLMMGMFLAALDQTVVSTAIRTIADDLQGFDLQAWATTAFLITSTIATPLYGKLSDMYGRRPFFIAAISIFVVGSALCGVSQSMYQLAAFRALQGVGAGGLFSLAFTIIGDIVPPRERSKYQGYFMAVFATSSVLGPVIGGLLAGTDSILGITGWRWIFWLNVPIGAAALVVVSRVLHLPHTRRDHRIDWPGALALITTLVPLLLVAEQGRSWGWSSTDALICYVIGAIGLVAFLTVENYYKDEALLPLRLFKISTFSLGGAGSFISGVGMFGGIMMLPLYLQIVKGSTPTVAGLQTLPMVAGIMAGGMITGKSIAKRGKYKMWPPIGMTLMAVALFLFSRIGASTETWQVMLIMPIFGFGLGFNMQPVILAVQNAVPPTDMGVATSSVPFFRQMGGTLGVAIFLSVLFTILPGNIKDEDTTAQTTPAFQQALSAHPDQAAVISSGSGSALQDTSFIQHLDHTIALPFQKGFSESMDVIFLIAAGVIAFGLVLMLFLPEVPLRQHSGLQARAEGGEPTGTAAAIG
jgi:EmrB/QacA subfamily drug resistance transporter